MPSTTDIDDAVDFAMTSVPEAGDLDTNETFSVRLQTKVVVSAMARLFVPMLAAVASLTNDSAKNPETTVNVRTHQKKPSQVN